MNTLSNNLNSINKVDASNVVKSETEEYLTVPMDFYDEKGHELVIGMDFLKEQVPQDESTNNKAVQNISVAEALTNTTQQNTQQFNYNRVIEKCQLNPEMENRETIQTPQIIMQESKPDVASVGTNVTGNEAKKIPEVIQENIKHNESTVLPEVMQETRRNDTKTFSTVKKENQRNNTYLVAQKFMQRVRLINLNNCLHFYNGICYKKLVSTEVKRMIVEKCRSEIEDLGMARYVDDVLSCLNYEPSIVCNEEQVSAQIITFKNCNLNVYDNKMACHTPEVLTTYCIQCDYNLLLGPPVVFNTFLYNITGGDVGIMQRIYEMIGYILSPDLGGKCFFLLQGCPNSGKSVLTALIASFFEKELCSAMDVHSLNERFAPAELSGKAICISPDLPSGVLDTKSVSKLKQFTGNDYICADVKNQAHIQFYCRAKFVLATNHPFLIKEKDDAFIQRVVPIPFCYSVPKEQQDPFILEKLKAERNAIAVKAINAYYKLRANHYKFSGMYELNSASYLYDGRLGEMDIQSCIYVFLRENYKQDETGCVFTDDAYDLFCNENYFINYNTFSHYFCKYVKDEFGGKKDRRRKTAGCNATSCVEGISLKKDM